MKNSNILKMSRNILIFLAAISIFPIIIVSSFLTNNVYLYLEKLNADYYSNHLEQVDINIQNEMDRIEKKITDFVKSPTAEELLFNRVYTDALQEVNYDNLLGNEIREKFNNNIEGDYYIVQFDRKSIVEQSPIKGNSYTLGQFHVDVNMLLSDPLYKSVENSDVNIRLGMFDENTLIGFESSKRPVILYPVRDKGKIRKLIILILSPEYVISFYKHIRTLNYGSIKILDINNNIMSVNHPSSGDYYKFYDKDNKYVSSPGDAGQDPNGMSLKDYNDLLIDKNIVNTPDVLSMFINASEKISFKRKYFVSSSIIEYKNAKYMTLIHSESYLNIKLLFFIPLKWIAKPIYEVVYIIAFITIIVMVIIIILIIALNIFFIRPIENQAREISDKNLHFMNLAHEIKTPLTLIRNYLDKYIKNNIVSDDLKVIKQNIYKLERDMINILDTRKLETGKMGYNHDVISNISKILSKKESLYREIALKKNIDMKFQISKDLFIKADQIALERIINNLIDNALKYTGSGGHIEVVLENVKDKIEFKVKDTGVGLSNSDLKKIFKPYIQIKNNIGSWQGAGLGLHIIYNIVKELKAQISVDSKIGNGSTFSVKFKPYKVAVAAVNSDFETAIDIVDYTDTIKNEITDDGKKHHDRNNILLIEDNKDLLYYLKTVLDEKYNVYFAVNGKDAINKLNDIIRPDLIISDVMMAEMNGFELLEYIKNDESMKEVPFIFLSAVSDDNEKIKGFINGAIDFINKPFQIDVLLARINSLIEFQKLKKQVFEKDKYATLGMLLGGISHEIFNPLLGIYAPLENLENVINKLNINEDIAEKLNKYIKDINKGLNRIENIVKCLKVLYYNKNLGKEKIDFKDVVISVFDLYKTKSKDKIELVLEIEEDFEIYADKSALSQILMNLISNAIDAVTGDGKITIKTWSKNGSYFSISDNGSGIESDNINNIFNAFFTTKEVGKGTGLGLYIVKDMCLKMNWEISVQSEIGKGSEFIIKFL